MESLQLEGAPEAQEPLVSAPAEGVNATEDAVAEAVRSGLTATRKRLPAWLFYDAEGSRLFECITRLPEYYLTRTERAIFEQSADEIIAIALRCFRVARPEHAGEPRLRVLELGAGTAAKTGVVLQAAVRAQGETAYLPIDVSATAIDEACESLGASLPQVRVQPLVANYVTESLTIPASDGPTLAMYIGSSIGNFSQGEAVSILRNLRAQLRPGDTLLLGTDLVKDTAVLEAAYCDADGVTEAFNLNMLRRLNRELGANFDVSRFRHVAYFNADASRIEMHLKSTHAQRVAVAALGLEVTFAAGETIHTENSYKFTRASVAALLREGGFEVVKTLTDAQGWFAVTLARVV